MRKITDFNKHEIEALVNLLTKCNYTVAKLMILFDTNKHTILKIIDDNVLNNSLVYKKAIDILYPEFKRCMRILETNQKELRKPKGTQDIVAKRAAIAVYMSKNKDSSDIAKIMGLLGRDRAGIYYYKSISEQPQIKKLIEKL